MRTSVLFCLALSIGSASAQVPCGDWTVTPVPVESGWNSTWLRDVSALSSDDAWSVGFYSVPKPGSGYEEFTYAAHWDGDAWTRVPTPNAIPYPGGSSCYLNTVAMVDSDDVWAAGSRYGDAGGLSVGMWIYVMHWDGTSWTEVSVQSPPGGVSINFSGTQVTESIAFAPDDVWFGGWWAEPNSLGSVTWRPLLMHWDGSKLEIKDGPSPHDGYYGFHVESFTATGPDDIWAACAKNTAGGDSTNVVLLHYDGASWTEAPVPDAPVAFEMNEVVARSANDVWAFGTIPWGTSSYVLHYDGVQWTGGVSGPYADAVVAHQGAFYFGTEPTAQVQNAGISLFDGATTTVLDPLLALTQPAFFAFDAYDPCGVWAVGRQFIAGEGLRPLAVRMDGSAGVWSTVGSGLPGTANLTPALTGTGAMSQGSPVQIALSDALPGATSFLVVGVGAANLPFAGGILVPTPSIVVTGLPVGPTGGWFLVATMPVLLPAGTELYLQAFVHDPVAVKGLAASPGLRAIAP